MKKNVILLVLASAATLAADAEFITDLGQGWRLTVGPQFNFNAKGRLGVKSRAIPMPSPYSSSTKAVAQAAGDGISAGSGRMEFPNGGYIDPDDAAGIAGETWNWRIPAGQLSGTQMSFSHPYTERSTTYSAIGGSDKDDGYSVGANFGLDRAIWKWGDFGVDLGFNFSFFIKDNWYKGQAGGYARTDTYKSGAYNTDVDLGNADVLDDPWARNPDGSYGAGSFDGPGPVLSVSDISVSHGWDAEQTSVSRSAYGPFSISGDLQMYEFQLAFKPYYDLTDWFMLRGTLGVGLDYRNLDVRVSGIGKSSENDWDCYLVCGLGGMFHWNDICLGADFLRKVFDDDMDVNTRYVSGSVDNASWIFRVYVGYEF